MKRVISLFALITVVSFTTFAKGPVAEGNTLCCLGTYVIEKAIDPIIINGKILPTFAISYENSDLTVRVGVDKTNKKSTSYIVVSDDLSIQYDCNSSYFGVKMLDKQYLDDGFATSNLALDKSEYFHQKVITRQVSKEIDCVKFISVYFPKLVNDYEKVFAVK